MPNMMPINNHHHATADGFHMISFSDDHACVFTEPNAETGWIGCYCLHESRKSSALVEVRIKNYFLIKSKACCNFYFAFHVSATAIAFINHGAAHGHSTCTRTNENKIFLGVAL